MKKLMKFIVVFVLIFMNNSILSYGNTDYKEEKIADIEDISTFNKNFRGGVAYNGEYYLFISGGAIAKEYRSLDGINW